MMRVVRSKMGLRRGVMMTVLTAGSVKYQAEALICTRPDMAAVEVTAILIGSSTWMTRTCLLCQKSNHPTYDSNECVMI